jgi:hypothetical protein
MVYNSCTYLDYFTFFFTTFFLLTEMEMIWFNENYFRQNTLLWACL